MTRRIGIIAALMLSVAAGRGPRAQTASPAPDGASHAAPTGRPASSSTADTASRTPKDAAPPVTKGPARPPASPPAKGAPHVLPSGSAGASEPGARASRAPAAGGEESIETLITKAGDALRHGEINNAIDHLESALDIARERAPLRARRFLLVKEDAPAFGQYVPRGSNVFRPGEEMLFYLEPENYTFRRRGDLYEASLRVDVNLLLPDGTVIYGKRNFFEQVFSARSKIHDLYLNLSLEVSGLEEGVYRVEYVVKDGFSDKQLSVHQNVVIREPQPVYYP